MALDCCVEYIDERDMLKRPESALTLSDNGPSNGFLHGEK